MELVKRYLFLIVTAAVTVLITGIAAVIIKGRIAEKEKFRVEVDHIVEAEKSFTASEYALNADNVTKAQERLSKADQKFGELIAQLSEKYPLPVVVTDMTPPKFKRHLPQVCIKMENMLRGEDVWIPDSLKYFTYDNYMKPDMLPSAEEVTAILKQLEVVQELVYLVSQSQVKQMTTFERLNDYKLIDRDLYDFMPFSVTLVGNLKSIQRFLNSLHDARFFLMVRTLDLEVAPIKRNDPPGKGREGTEELLPKNKRLVYDDDPPDLKVKVVVDYFEFHDKE